MAQLPYGDQNYTAHEGTLTRTTFFIWHILHQKSNRVIELSLLSSVPNPKKTSKWSGQLRTPELGLHHAMQQAPGDKGSQGGWHHSSEVEVLQEVLGLFHW